MRTDRVVVHAPNDKGKSLPGRGTECLSLLLTARVKINVSMVPGNSAQACTPRCELMFFSDGKPTATLVARPASIAAHEVVAPPPAHGPWLHHRHRASTVPSGRETFDALRATARLHYIGYIGGVIPRPTAIRGACRLPSAWGLAAAMNIAALGFNSSLSPGTNETMGTSGGTTIFLSPSLYFTVRT